MLVELAGGLDAVEHRHGDVHEHDVGPQLGRQAQGLLAVGRLADDLEPLLLHRAAQPLAEHAVVVGEQQATAMAQVFRSCGASSRQRTVVPRSGTESMSMRAPTASARSLMPVSP